MPVNIHIKTGEVTQAMRVAADETVQDYSVKLKEKIAELMGEPKHGIQYPDLPNVSSAPGEAPAIQSESYVDSIMPESLGFMKARVYTDDVRAIRFEFGDAKVKARPHFTPAVESLREQFYRDIGENVIQAAEE